MKNTKHLISVTDLTAGEMQEVFSLTHSVKSEREKFYNALAHRTLAMIFQKPSTRTRVSFETGMTQLGGHAIFLSNQELQLKRGETIADTSRTLSRYVDAIMIRSNNHRDVLELAGTSSVPVINGLSDIEHPCQVLGDIYTILEKKSTKDLSHLKTTFIGDGNNVSNSLMLASAVLGMHFVLCTPEGYEPPKGIIEKSIEIARRTGAKIEILSSPVKAVDGSDIIYTDVWTSMGKEEEQSKRKEIFTPYQVNSGLLSRANPSAIVMHCLPARRGEEITDEVMDGPSSVVFDQAENRMHVQKAILLYLLKETCNI
ncbi:MAG: ornithine carbamoyltransferase [Elusimicrobiota bacterium]